MSVTTYKQVPTHAEWKKTRDAAGGKSGLSSKANIGKLLDEYQKNKTKKKERAVALEQLDLGLRNYVGEPKVRAIKDLLATVLTLQKVVTLEIRAMKMDKDIGLAVARTVMDGLQRLDKVEAEIKAQKIEEAKTTYEKFFDGIGRGMGKILPSGDIRNYWEGVTTTAPTRDQLSGVKGPLKSVALMVQGIKEYRAALKKVLEMGEKAGYALKL